MKNALLLVAALLVTLARPTAAVAQPGPNPDHAELKRAAFNQTALRPGDKAMLAVELEIKEGFHAQSRTPSEDFLI
jgi:hypothetical protein